jgi:O-antigen/teichoic acid export membrane protein
MEYITLKNRILNSKLINDSFWALIGNIIGKGLSLAAGIFVARFLGKEVFGEYGIVKNTIMLIAAFSTFGLGYTATKYIAEYKNNKSEYTKLVLHYATKITLAFSGVMALILFLTAEYFAEYVLSDHHLKTPLRIISILIVFNALTTMQIGVIAGFGKFKEMARINSI